MHEEPGRLLQRLEQATTHAAKADGELDAETARLGEGWRVLARLLEAAETEMDPAPLLAAVRRRSGRRRRRMAIAVLALAASLLAAATVARRWSTMPRHGARPVAPQAMAPRQPKADGAPAADAAVGGPQRTALAWNDSLDDQFDRVRQGIVYYDRRQCLDRLDFSVLDRRMDRIVQEMNEL